MLGERAQTVISPSPWPFCPFPIKSNMKTATFARTWWLFPLPYCSVAPCRVRSADLSHERGSEMVAVSLFFSALISLLLLSPIKDWAVAHAKSHGEWLLEARRFYRRSEHLSYGERDYSCDECRENEAGNGSSLRDLEEEFINRSRSVKFAGPLLIHIVCY